MKKFSIEFGYVGRLDSQSRTWNPVKIFRRRMQNLQHYVIKVYNIMQHYITRGDISPHIRRLIAVNDRFCGDNCS